MGFYNLSAYLQVAALQAEYLCRLAEAHSLKKAPKAKEIAQIVLDTLVMNFEIKPISTVDED